MYYVNTNNSIALALYVSLSGWHPSQLDVSSLLPFEVANSSGSLSVGPLADQGNMTNPVIENGLSVGLKILIVFANSVGSVEALYGTETVYGSEAAGFNTGMKFYNITNKLQTTLMEDPRVTDVKLIPPIGNLPCSAVNYSQHPYPSLPLSFFSDEGSLGLHTNQLDVYYNGTSQNCESMTCDSIWESSWIH